MQNEAVITIKLSDSELGLLVNSLGMLESTIVPCVDNGKWKIPYEVLKKDLQKVQKDVIDKRKKHVITKLMGSK